jgi:hypothetical protein
VTKIAPPSSFNRSTVKAARCALLFLLSAAAAKAGGPPARVPVQLLPLPAIAAPPVPAPLPPPINPGVAAASPVTISPLLLQPGPPFLLPQQASPPSPPALLPAPIDQQKVTSYRIWLHGQQRLLERSGGSPDDYLGRQIQQQLQLDQPGGTP